MTSVVIVSVVMGRGGVEVSVDGVRHDDVSGDGVGGDGSGWWRSVLMGSDMMTSMRGYNMNEET
jgi:hypothetical protein